MSNLLIYVYWFMVMEGTDIELYGVYHSLKECQAEQQEILEFGPVNDSVGFYVSPCELREFSITIPPSFIRDKKVAA
jgi:hypothetical protein